MHWVWPQLVQLLNFIKAKDMTSLRNTGPLAAVTPGTVGGLCYMLANYGTMSLKDVLKPAMDLAAGYPIDAQTAKLNGIKKK
jgi:gamma-glutamyltranspeptidase/glutathione hydrolase